MDFIDQLNAIATRIPKQIEVIQTEEATKNAFIMPFIAAWGYNVFDPSEVVPEFTADIGLKKGEKVDYAILKDGKPIILFECKWHGADLDQAHASQLHRYFHATDARIGVLTNGISYKFFSDLEEPNKMDTKPFLELNMLDMKANLVEEVKRFSKGTFVLDDIISAATELKYLHEIKRLLSEQMNNPSEEFVKFFASQVYSGKLTQNIRQQFTDFTKRALSQFINDRINERLKSALSAETSRTVIGDGQPATDSSPSHGKEERAVVGRDLEIKTERPTETTPEELEAYHIVKAILRQHVDPKRIALRDTQSYAGILLDDNNRKPICRLRFNGPSKSIGILDATKNEERISLSDLNELYALADKLVLAVNNYDRPSDAQPVSEK